MESVIVNLDNFLHQSCMCKEPQDVFSCWFMEISLISGNLHHTRDITSCWVLGLNSVFQEMESENVSVVKASGTSNSAPSTL